MLRSSAKKPAKNSKLKVVKTEAEWKSELSPEQYEVLRKKGTESAFTGKYWDHFEKGQYVCAACDNPLFDSQTKFESDCGWPSFDQAIKGSEFMKMIIVLECQELKSCVQNVVDI